MFIIITYPRRSPRQFNRRHNRPPLLPSTPRVQAPVQQQQIIAANLIQQQLAVQQALQQQQAAQLQTQQIQNLQRMMGPGQIIIRQIVPGVNQPVLRAATVVPQAGNLPPTIRPGIVPVNNVVL